MQLDPSLEAAVQALLGSMYRNEEKLTEGLAAADRALELDPGYFFAHVVRARCCARLGLMPEACASFRHAVEIDPHPEPHSSLLFQMNTLSETTPETLYAEACRWNSLYAAPLAKQIRPHTNTPDPDRRLKVGYVSPDLYNHAIMKFIPPVVDHHDRSRFEVFVYSVGTKLDAMTEQLRGTVENYVSIQGLYADLAERIRADGIDILVDLAGHTMGPAYLAFALKPAPVQISWIGALSTTGMATMDYFLGDAHVPSPGTEHLFTENVYRLPGSLCCYRPNANIPVAPSPCLQRGYVTFGSFNRHGKITRGVVKLWSAILHLAPGSRLLMKYHNMDQDAVQGKLRGWFLEDGIPRERLMFEGADPPLEYLNAFGGIDIALDPFPYNGGSTTLDTLWMGVPVVTLAGRLAVQCCGASMLSTVGLNDLIAYTPEDYLKAALFLAETVPKMPDLRPNVRQALLSSPLMDEVGHVRSVEAAYREMWRTWCRAKH
jgi:predicted O-linked N-acetylglucosamine transferase (SPINDLY family)